MATSAAENELRRLFKRCVQCPPISPQCPNCSGGRICSLVPQDCNTCAHMKCIDDPNPAPISHGPNVGAIAGGVVAGVAFVTIVVFFIWLFWIKKKRQQQDQELEEEWANDEISSQKRHTRFTVGHDGGSSTRTRGSLANSILSRASNFIQIAYIPGVTNRNGSERNSIVPPIPAAQRQGNQPNKSPLSQEGDALFFGIDDLRGSTYSGASSIRDTRHSTNRDTRYTMQSITPSLARDSVASDVQWESGIAAPVIPASTVAKVAPRMVSVKSSGASSASTSGSGSTTPENAADGTKPVQVLIPGQGPSPSSSVRGKATQVTVGSNKKKGRFPIRSNSDTLTTTTTTHAPLNPSPLAEITDADPLISTSPPIIQPTDSPFFDASELPPSSSTASPSRPNPYASMARTVGVGTNAERGGRRGGSKGKIGGLSAVIEEATKRASTGTVSGIVEGRDPFGDENEVERT